MTGLPECGLGCGYDLACGSDLVDGYGRWIYFVRTLVGWFIFVIPVCWPDTRTSVYESRGWYFSRCTAG